MTIPDGDWPAEDNSPAPTPSNRYGKGRPKGTSITAALRSKCDPDVIAEIIAGMITDPKTPARERLAAIGMVTDRLEGKALSRSVSMSLGASRALPAEFDVMSPEAKDRVLDTLRRRALAGDPALLENNSAGASAGDTDGE